MVNLAEKFSEDEQYDDMVFYDGLENAFVGIGWRFHDGPIAIYDREKVFEILTEEMSYEAAIAHFDFNIIGGWVGDKTPIFITLGTPDDFVEST